MLQFRCEMLSRDCVQQSGTISWLGTVMTGDLRCQLSAAPHKSARMLESCGQTQARSDLMRASAWISVPAYKGGHNGSDSC